MIIICDHQSDYKIPRSEVVDGSDLLRSYRTDRGFKQELLVKVVDSDKSVPQDLPDRGFMRCQSQHNVYTIKNKTTVRRYDIK